MSSTIHRCQACGGQLDPRDSYCGQCGTRQTLAQGSPESERESELWRGGYSWLAAYREYALAILISLGLAVLHWNRPDFLPILWLLVVLTVLGLALAVRVLLRILDVRYVLTDQRLLHRNGLLYWRTERIELIDIDDIRFEQGLVDHVLDLGRIVLISSDRSDPNLVLDGIARGPWVCETIEEARRTERRRRGLFVESI